ncbi:MAG TPA: hypothetical protein VIK79_03335 [Xanthobacteraceae bacterium]
MTLRTQGQPSVQLVVNAAGVRARFRYLHMSPRHLDADGLLSGRFLHAGQIIGKVANFLGARPGTTSHLHFDLQVPTRYGWVFVNPYMTLVSAYERLIRARGRELKTTLPVDAAIDPMIASARASAVRSTPADTARRSTGADADTGP